MEKKYSEKNSTDFRITEGVIWKELIRYFIPIFAGTLFQQSYSTVDAIIVGRYVGKEALAATDVTGGAINFLISIAIGISSAGGILIAQRFGAKDEEGLKQSVHTTFSFMVVAGVVTSILGVVLAPQICMIMRAPGDMFDEALTYTRVYLSGSLFILVFDAGTAILRAIGDSKRPFYFLMISCLVNIGLDLFFVIVFQMGIGGAALASVVSQAISAFLVILLLFRTKQSYGLKIKACRIETKTLLEMIKIGVPIVLQSSTLSISTIFLQSGVNKFGTEAVSAWSINGKMDYMLWMLIQSMGIAATTFVAQNYGAGKKDRMFKSLKASGIMFFVVIGSMSVLLYFLTPLISFVFTPEPQIVKLASDMMKVIAPFYVATFGGNILSSVIRGTGESLRPMLLTLIGTCGVSIIWVLVISSTEHTVFHIIAGFPAAWIVTSVMYIVYYRFSVRKRWMCRDTV